MLLNESKDWLDQSKVESGVEWGSVIWGLMGVQAQSELIWENAGKGIDDVMMEPLRVLQGRRAARRATSSYADVTSLLSASFFRKKVSIMYSI